MKLYPVVIHKYKKSAFGVTIPDLPGCFSAGTTLDEALRNVQEAIEVHLHGEDLAPEPSALDRWKAELISCPPAEAARPASTRRCACLASRSRDPTYVP